MSSENTNPADLILAAEDDVSLADMEDEESDDDLSDLASDDEAREALEAAKLRTAEARANTPELTGAPVSTDSLNSMAPSRPSLSLTTSSSLAVATGKPPLAGLVAAAELVTSLSSPRYLGYGPGMSPALEETIDKVIAETMPSRGELRKRGTASSSTNIAPTPSSSGARVQRSPTAPDLLSVTTSGGIGGVSPSPASTTTPSPLTFTAASSSAAASQQQQTTVGVPPVLTMSTTSPSQPDLSLPQTNGMNNSTDSFENIPLEDTGALPNSPVNGSQNDFVDILLGPPRLGLKIIYWFLGVNPDKPDSSKDLDSMASLPTSPMPLSPQAVNLSTVYPEWYIKSVSILSYRRLLRLWSGYPPSFGERLTWFVVTLILCLGLLAISILRVIANPLEWPMLAVSVLLLLYGPRFIMALPLGPRLGVIVVLAAGETVIALEFAVNQSHVGFIEFLRTSVMMQIVVGVVGGLCAIVMIAFIGHFLYWYFFFPLLLFANFDPSSILARTVGRWPVLDWKVARFDPAELQARLGTEMGLGTAVALDGTLRRRKLSTLKRTFTAASTVSPALNPFQASSGWYRFRVVEPRTVFQLGYRKNTFRYIWDNRSYGRAPTTGRPHGWGIWESSDMGGESIEGFWVDGEPTAPFLAVEARTGCATRAIRVGLAESYLVDFDNGYVVPGIDMFRDGLRWILVSVECSVSGTFFSHLPRAVVMRRDGNPVSGTVENVPYPTTCDDIVNRLKVSLRPPGEDDEQIFAESGIKNSAATPSSQQASSSSAGVVPVPLVSDSNFVPKPLGNGSGGQARECIIFVHGYNTPPKWAVQMLGQVLTLGEFPSNIRPFVYAWPGGASYMSFFTARRNAAKPEVSERLIEMIKALTAQGFVSFHLIAHSMGSRVVSSLAKPDNPDAPLDSPCPLARLFRPATRSHSHFKESNNTSMFGTGAAFGGYRSRRVKTPIGGAQGQGNNVSPVLALANDGQLPELASFTLIAAEIDLQLWQSYFINVYRHCRLVTIYSDEYDVALRIARSLDAKARLGASAGKMGTTGFFESVKRAGTAISEVPGQVFRAGTNIIMGRPSADATGASKKSMDARPSTSNSVAQAANGSAGTSSQGVGQDSVAIPMEDLRGRAATPSTATNAPRISSSSSLEVPSGGAPPLEIPSAGVAEAPSNLETVTAQAGDSQYLSNFSIPSTLASLDRSGQASESSLPPVAEVSPAVSAAQSFSPAKPPAVTRVPTVRFSVEGTREDIVGSTSSVLPQATTNGTPTVDANSPALPAPYPANNTSSGGASSTKVPNRYPNLPGIQYFDYDIGAYMRYILAHGMDVVDCSNLDANTHLVRHSTFTLNRQMVDDLFDIVVSRKRARDRDSRLVRLDRNRWQFRVAPLWRSAAS